MYPDIDALALTAAGGHAYVRARLLELREA